MKLNNPPVPQPHCATINIKTISRLHATMQVFYIYTVHDKWCHAKKQYLQQLVTCDSEFIEAIVGISDSILIDFIRIRILPDIHWRSWW